MRRYKTQRCKQGTACNRPVCFFAHHASEVRQPTLDEPPEAPTGSQAGKGASPSPGPGAGGSSSGVAARRSPQPDTHAAAAGVAADDASPRDQGARQQLGCEAGAGVQPQAAAPVPPAAGRRADSCSSSSTSTSSGGSSCGRSEQRAGQPVPRMSNAFARQLGLNPKGDPRMNLQLLQQLQSVPDVGGRAIGAPPGRGAAQRQHQHERRLPRQQVHAAAYQPAQQPQAGGLGGGMPGGVQAYPLGLPRQPQVQLLPLEQQLLHPGLPVNMLLQQQRHSSSLSSMEMAAAAAAAAGQLPMHMSGPHPPLIQPDAQQLELLFANMHVNMSAHAAMPQRVAALQLQEQQQQQQQQQLGLAHAGEPAGRAGCPSCFLAPAGCPFRPSRSAHAQAGARIVTCPPSAGKGHNGRLPTMFVPTHPAGAMGLLGGSPLSFQSGSILQGGMGQDSFPAQGPSPF